MPKSLRWILILGTALIGWSAAAQEVIVFKDFRALVVQSHRVDGVWTYLRVGAGEMAVPSDTILQVTQESGQLVSAAPRPAMTPQAPPGAPLPRPVPGAPRMAPPPSPPPSEGDDESEESDNEGDEEEAAPPPSLPVKPNLPQSMTPRPAPFPSPAPVETKEKDD